MSKNVNVNGVDYSGVSQVQLKTASGGTVLFKDVDEIVTPSGSVTITENGTHNVANYAQAVVNVASSGNDGGDFQEMFYGLVDGTISGDVVLPSSVSKIKETMFSKTGITSISMPGVTRIEDNAFSSCTGLSLTELPDGLEYIGQNCFSACSKVVITEIPATVKEMPGNYVFYTSGTKTLTFKGTPDVIGKNALAGVATVNVPWAEGEVANAPWGAGTVNYNYTGA